MRNEGTERSEAAIKRVDSTEVAPLSAASSRMPRLVRRARAVKCLRAAAVALMFLLCAELLQGCALLADLAEPAPLAPTPLVEEYRIGAGDKLRISVWGQDTLDSIIPVRPDGMISVPLVDDVQATGLTVFELKSLLTQMLEEYIASPDVTVVVMEVGSKMIYVTGEVNRPGAFPLDREYRVLDALTLSGGFTPYANKRQIKIIRYQNEVPQEFRFNYSKFVGGKAPQSNIVLRPGDTVIVSE